MGKFEVLKNEEIIESLQGVTRQYLAGNLQKPQFLPFFKTELLEIGITSYEDFSSEPSHRHTTADEYQYMLSGRTQYMDVDTGDVHEYIKGDFYKISAGTSYAQRSKPGTEILFIKVPSINDKELVEESEDVISWRTEKLKTVRKDYYYASDAPKPNSIRPAAAVAIVNEDKLLMLKRGDNAKWTMPGGTLDFGESLIECATREVKEETGLDVNVIDVIGTYTDPNILVAYSDGEVRQEFTIVYASDRFAGDVQLDEESTAYSWISFDDVMNIEMASSQKRRVQDVIAYYRNGKKKMG